MCDTLIALGDATADGSVILAKNSDRDANEAHQLTLIPRATHAPGSTARCTYVEIPQAPQTFAVLLAQPFWIWGAEMGANEHGVLIGNEAVFTKVPYDKKPGLIGMDLLRLALERAATARAALDTLTSLLETYGQGGNCSLARKLYYHNSFLIADPQQAWVLETAGRHWAAVCVRDVYSISNALTIGSEWDLASDDLVRHAVERGWCRDRDDFHFARCYSDFLFTRFGGGPVRHSRTQQLLLAASGQITVQTMAAILRDHGPHAGPSWRPAPGLTDSHVCMHASFGPVRFSQSVGSMISHLADGLHTHWVTGTSAPCTSLFKPVWLDAGLPDTGPPPAKSYDQASLWWRHERLHRETLRDFATRLPLYQAERDALEAEFLAGAAALPAHPADERAAFSARCFARADEAAARWLQLIRDETIRQRLPLPYALAWRRVNRRAGLA
ncbi:MAG: C69 family dipeptidase [Chloroflexota bacterium]